MEINDDFVVTESVSKYMDYLRACISNGTPNSLKFDWFFQDVFLIRIKGHLSVTDYDALRHVMKLEESCSVYRGTDIIYGNFYDL